jgi:hypothetical protein
MEAVCALLGAPALIATVAPVLAFLGRFSDEIFSIFSRNFRIFKKKKYDKNTPVSHTLAVIRV